MTSKLENGILYLLPTPIADDALYSLSMEVASHTTEVTHYFAENVRTARRFLRALHPHLNLEKLHFSEIDKHSGPDIALLREWLKKGYNVGLMSEAGCPGIADPGAELVAVAHKVGARVVPLTGPNSLMLALMASGLNGQSFAFNGYLPVKEPARSKRIKELEARSQKEHQTQIFIETPYRNDALLADLLKNCSLKTRICLGQNITAHDEMIVTKTAAEWQKQIPKLGKTPAVFLLLG
ncbi:MAG: Uroporphyrin-III C/tetrapyrrole (Corrin/Porphyrin) methyltransferase [Flavipsychrobacter sp.]|jgi:16S rRNA (cytidine1402-2'-O)-methyltransferase|nr:Uroporphyrin-III C/tetrapyrrole (Corrin/Porphyrin) methyltransferase [Flavipsychrobacter sp.]